MSRRAGFHHFGRGGFEHQAEVGVYTGNARAWQENNYVRADQLILRQKQGELYGEGAVQSLLYDAKKRENGVESNVPVFARIAKDFLFQREKPAALRNLTWTSGKAQTESSQARRMCFLNDRN
jgi:hypothetical protein